jgi:membrane associated rhomboid family serine protease
VAVSDRDYMRKRPLSWMPSGSSWTVRVLIALVVVHVLAGMFPAVRENTLLSWPILRSGRVWTLVLATLGHANASHLVGNLIGVWVFGGIAEEALGRRGFVRLTLMATIGAWIPYLVVQAITGDSVPTLGASGVVLAYVAAAALRRPETPIHLMGVFPVPLWLLGLVFVALDLGGISGQFSGGGVGVNHMVHLTGALIGWWAHRTDARFGLPARTSGASWPSRRSAVKAPGRLDPHGPAARDEVNRLLDKIADKGIGSLSEAEREFLNRASKGYR